MQHSIKTQEQTDLERKIGEVLKRFETEIDRKSSKMDSEIRNIAFEFEEKITEVSQKFPGYY